MDIDCVPTTRETAWDPSLWLVISERAGRFLANCGFIMAIFLTCLSEADGGLRAADDDDETGGFLADISDQTPARTEIPCNNRGKFSESIKIKEKWKRNDNVTLITSYFGITVFSFMEIQDSWRVLDFRERAREKGILLECQKAAKNVLVWKE